MINVWKNHKVMVALGYHVNDWLLPVAASAATTGEYTVIPLQELCSIRSEH